MPKTLMDGTEQTLFENTELGEYSGYIFLDKMLTGDTITIKCYVKDEEDGEYKLADSQDFTNVQSVKAVRIAQVCGKTGLKFTARQSVGTYRQVDHCWFKRG